LRIKDRMKQWMFVAFDLILINVAFILAIQFRFLRQTDLGYTNIYFENAIPITLIYLFVFYFSRVYKMVFTQKMWDEIRYCFMANLIAPIVVFVFALAFGSRLPYSVYILTMIIATYLTVGFRIGLVILFGIYRNWKYGNSPAVQKSNVLIIGAGEASRLVIEEMKYKKRYNVVAVLDDSPNKKGRFINGVKVVGHITDIEKTVDDFDIDEICFCITMIDAENKREILKRCADTGLKVKTIPSIYDIVDESVTITNFKNVDIEDLLQRNAVDLNIDSIETFILGKTIMVTGAGGSIGAELVRQIARFKPSKLVFVDTYENTTYELFREILGKYTDIACEVVIGSVADKGEIFSIVESKRPDVILHAAAHKHVPLMENNSVRAFNNNVVGTKNVALASDKYNVEKFVMISSDKAVRPTNIMGATKRIAEMIIVEMDAKSDTIFTSVRFGNVLGSHGSVIPLFERQIKDGGPVTVTHPDMTRYFMTIPEASQLVLQAGALAMGGEIFMLDMGIPVKIDNLARNMIKLSGFEPDVDIPIEYTGLRPGEKMFEELSFSEETVTKTMIEKIYCLKAYESLKTGAMDIVADMEKIGRNESAMRHAIWQIVPKFDENEKREIVEDLSIKIEV
jgi:FlaA1/EpsC-like NDP-sugar epimerase